MDVERIDFFKSGFLAQPNLLVLFE
jgi:hypothetical protein